jgi:cellulose synthase/poly-beta-1,6-N-acetylglucosamine synthase-like glycosyltransferase
VSVIVPAWTERGTIERCLTGLEGVDYPVWETIVVAGGSDGTYAAAVEACRRLPNARVIEQQPLGKPTALNDGVDVADGTVIVLLDADSGVTRDWLRELIAPINEDVPASTGNFLPYRLTPISRTEQMERISSYEVRASTTLQGSGSIAVTRGLLEELGEFPPDAYADDWILDARLAARGIVRAFCPAAMLRSERPATLSEYWANEIRWRRAHLLSLFQVREYFLRDALSVLRSFYPYLVGWGIVLLATFTAAAFAAGLPELAGYAAAFLGIGLAWTLMRRVELSIEVAAFTRDRRWLREAWAPPLLFAVTLLAGVAASVSLHRASLQFKGPRRIEPASPS